MNTKENLGFTLLHYIFSNKTTKQKTKKPSVWLVPVKSWLKNHLYNIQVYSVIYLRR